METSNIRRIRRHGGTTEVRRRERLAELVLFVQEHGVRLVLKPSHPMYVADRAVLSTLGQALALAAPHPSDVVAVVVDTFHVFWDPARAGQSPVPIGTVSEC